MAAKIKGFTVDNSAYGTHMTCVILLVAQNSHQTSADRVTFCSSDAEQKNRTLQQLLKHRVRAALHNTQHRHWATLTFDLAFRSAIR